MRKGLREGDPILFLENPFWNTFGQELHPWMIICESINWQNNKEDHFPLTSSKGRHDQPRTIAEHRIIFQEKCLCKKNDAIRQNPVTGSILPANGG